LDNTIDINIKMSDIKIDTKELTNRTSLNTDDVQPMNDNTTGNRTPLSPSRSNNNNNSTSPHEHAPAPPPSTMAVYPHELSLTNSPLLHSHSLAHSPLSSPHNLTVGTHLPQIPSTAPLSPSSLSCSTSTSPKANLAAPNHIPVRRSSLPHSPIVTSMLSNSPIQATLPLVSRSTSPYSISRSRSPHTSPPRSPQLEHGSLLTLHNEHMHSLSQLQPLTPLPEAHPLSHSLSNPPAGGHAVEEEPEEESSRSTSLSQMKANNKNSSAQFSS
jgi:hypothetical protein